MIVLDTNVVSEAMLALPAESVRRWMKSIPSVELFTTAVTRAEVLLGIAIMPQGLRRRQIDEVAARVFASAFGDRILPFDPDAAAHFATICAKRRRMGRPIEKFDAQIAAIAASRGAAVATRDIDGFADCGIDVINPWRG